MARARRTVNKTPKVNAKTPGTPRKPPRIRRVALIFERAGETFGGLVLTYHGRLAHVWRYAATLTGIPYKIRNGLALLMGGTPMIREESPTDPVAHRFRTWRSWRLGVQPTLLFF
jgi:hypothetical protein